MPVKHIIRSSKADGSLVEVSLTRTEAMAAMCQECMGFEKSPHDCRAVTCPVWPWRRGSRKASMGLKLTPEQAKEYFSTHLGRPNDLNGL